MSEILPRREEGEIEQLLALARPVGRFRLIHEADKDHSLMHSPKGVGRLHYIKFRDAHAPNFLFRPQSGERVSGLKDTPYDSTEIAYESELALNSSSLVELLGNVPLLDIVGNRCAAFETVVKNIYGPKFLAEVRLYERE